MTTPSFEAFLAKLYTDADTRVRFLENPEAAAADSELSAEEIRYLAAIDRVGLRMAARTFALKRARAQRTRFRYIKVLREAAQSLGRTLRRRAG
jgi:hypothetical protein